MRRICSEICAMVLIMETVGLSGDLRDARFRLVTPNPFSREQ